MNAYHELDNPRGLRAQGSYSRMWRAFAWIAAIMTLILITGSIVAYAAYRNLYGNIHHEDVTGLLGARPPKYNSALNVLIIGSDSRAGANARYGAGVQGARSDTTILMHVSPDRSGATMISFPRDSMVQTLDCKNDGQGHPGQQANPSLEMLNSTFSNGGAPCLWKTLEAMTGVHIDHFVQIDFSGFQSMVNAVGGVDVCLPYPITDRASGLNLPAGMHHVMGDQALSFVRVRHIGDYSDLERIKRQQLFIASLTKEVTSANILTNAPKLYSFASAATKSLTADSSLDVGTMVQIAQSMRGLHTSKVNLVQVPVEPYPADPNRVVWTQPDASQLFGSIEHDTAVPKAAKKPAKSAGAGKPRQPALKPSQVQLEVLNGTTTQGLSGQTAGDLTHRGFNVLGNKNADRSDVTKTVIQYGSSRQTAAVATLMGVLYGAQTEQVSALSGSTTVNLVLGSDFKGLKAPSNLTKQLGGITANTNICKGAQGAF